MPDEDRLASAASNGASGARLRRPALNLIGDTKQYGKESAGDLWEGKRTLILIELLRRCSADERSDLEQFFAVPRAQKSQEQVGRVLPQPGI